MTTIAVIALLLVILYFVTRSKDEPYEMDAKTAGNMWDEPKK